MRYILESAFPVQGNRYIPRYVSSTVEDLQGANERGKHAPENTLHALCVVYIARVASFSFPEAYRTVVGG